MAGLYPSEAVAVLQVTTAMIATEVINHVESVRFIVTSIVSSSGRALLP